MTIDRLADCLEPRGDDLLRETFNAAGARPPQVLWAPRDAELHHPALRRFAALCDAATDGEGRVRAAAITAEALGPDAGWLMLIDIEGEDGSGPLRYRYYGARIADHFGHDMTGRTTADFGGHISEFIGALYLAAARNGQRVWSEHEPASDIFVRRWQRLIVPVCDDTGRVSGFAALNIPENELRAGLEMMVDPVFVVNAERVIQYSNKAARRFFGIERPRVAPATLVDITGIDLNLDHGARRRLAQGESVDSIELVVRGAIVERLVMTVSLTQSRGQDFHVLVMRLIGT